MSFWAALILTVLQIVKEVLPLFFRKKEEGGVDKAVRRARDLQFERAKTARLMAERGEDELTKNTLRKLRLLDMLFRERRLREDVSRKPTNGT
jgi:cytochrome c-type biogenesis protein CcmH/NrfG